MLKISDQKYDDEFLRSIPVLSILQLYFQNIINAAKTCYYESHHIVLFLSFLSNFFVFEMCRLSFRMIFYYHFIHIVVVISVHFHMCERYLFIC